MGEVCDGMRALAGRLNCPGMDCSPAKSTAGDALRDRDGELFRLFYIIYNKYLQLNKYYYLCAPKVIYV
jgi:hypothetical protein